MKIDNLIWTKATIVPVNEPNREMQHVSVSYTSGDLFWLREYTSSQGVNTGRQMSFSQPVLVRMDLGFMVIRATDWGTKEEVLITLEF